MPAWRTARCKGIVESVEPINKIASFALSVAVDSQTRLTEPLRSGKPPKAGFLAGRAPSFYTIAEALLFVFGLWLVAPQPVAYVGGGDDDLLFVKLANAILDGHWLGPYTPDTLVKGPFYPLFLAAAALLRVPIQIATQAVVLAAALLAARLAGALLRQRAAATFCFAVLVSNPAPVDGIATLLLREPLYAGLLLLTVALAGRCYLFAARRLWLVGLGFAFAAVCLTREEGIVILPSIGLLAFWRAVHGWRRGELAHQILMPLVIPAAVAALPLLGVAELNRIQYGVFRTADYRASPIVSAYSALSRVKHDHWLPTVPISRDALARAYAASPTARLMQPNLDGGGVQFWAKVSCDEQPLPGCNEIEAGWIMWALRGAAASAGQYGSAKQADRFYRRLAKEIDTACDAGSIPCVGRRHSILPPMRAAFVPLILSDTWQVAVQAAQLGPVRPGAIPTLVTPDLYPVYRRVTPGAVQSPPQSIATPATLGLPPPQRSLATFLADVWCAVMPFGLSAALIWTAYLVASDLRRRRSLPLTAFAAAVSGAVVARIVFLGVTLAMLGPVSFRYIAPIFPFELLLVAMCTAAGLIKFQSALPSGGLARFRRRRRHFKDRPDV
jgi:hypothetical protein